jgi:hypothetical protein
MLDFSCPTECSSELQTNPRAELPLSLGKALRPGRPAVYHRWVWPEALSTFLKVGTRFSERRRPILVL